MIFIILSFDKKLNIRISVISVMTCYQNLFFCKSKKERKEK